VGIIAQQRQSHRTVCFKVVETSQAWWRTPVILALGKLRQEDSEVQASLGLSNSKTLSRKSPLQKKKVKKIFGQGVFL
jgi:hypothetical protein